MRRNRWASEKKRKAEVLNLFVSLSQLPLFRVLAQANCVVEGGDGKSAVHQGGGLGARTGRSLDGAIIWVGGGEDALSADKMMPGFEQDAPHGRW